MTKSSILDMCTLSEHEYGFLPIQQHCMLKKNKSRVAMHVWCPLSCVKIDPCDYFLSEEVNKIHKYNYLGTISQLVKS